MKEAFNSIGNTKSQPGGDQNCNE